ncbi:MAG: DUF2142 domain-containing protein [Gluconacetobacter diazotrophicus]|nr:DUF2142 domain-containing protein [Gluconacetobacter diazotrophicus]
MSPRATARLLALLFLFYGTIAVPALAVLMPPFQAADEMAHLGRADQVERGGMLARRIPEADTSGGRVHPGFSAVDQALLRLRAGRDTRIDPAELRRLKAVPLGVPADAPFPNTAAYPPLFYGPDAAAIAVGERLNFGAVRTARLARLCNGAVAVLLGCWAIGRGRRLAPALFFVLSLPMSLALFASASQDGPMLAATALLVSLLGAPPDGRGARLALPAAAVLIGAVAAARPPYAAMALLLPILAPPGRRMAASGWAAGAVLLVAAWTIAVDRWVMARPVAAAIAAQLGALEHRPATIATVAWGTAVEQVRHGLPWVREAIGVLGWLDVLLPGPYYAAALVVGALAFAASRPEAGMAAVGWRRWAVAGLLVLSAVGIVLSIYLSWTAVGARTVDGVQGRYFLPLLLAGVLVLPPATGRWSGRRHLAACVVVAWFPCVSIAASVCAVAARYYGA